MPTEYKANYFLLIGAPGTGKTAALNRLRENGCACRDEAARFVLEEQLAISGPALPSKDPLLFVQAMQKKSIEDFENAKSLKGPVFFDRGMPDLVHYAIRFNVAPAEFEANASRYRYNRNIFVFSPWKEIYVNDHVRPLPFEKTIKIQELLIKVNASMDYNLIPVPQGPTDIRAEFILNEAGRTEVSRA